MTEKEAPVAAVTRWEFADRWEGALTHERFVAEAAENGELWRTMTRLARVPDWAAERARALPGAFRLVVLSEAWCGDAVSTMPAVARWAEAAGIPLRVLRRDEHPEVMDRYLTNGTARAIPVVIVLTDDFRELGWWGPRPAELQAWVMQRRAEGRSKADLYPEIRKWYARDRGESTLREVLALLERAG